MKKGPLLIAINDLSYGGGQRTVVEEANELSKRGEDVYVLTTLSGAKMDLQNELQISREKIVHIPFSSVFDQSGYKALFALLRKIKPDIIFSNLYFTNTIIRISKLFFFSIRIVVREGNVPRQKSLVSSLVDMFLSTLTHCVISNSEFGRKSLRLQTLFSKTVVIYNGIDSRFFKKRVPEEKEIMRERLGIKKDVVVFLSVGALVPKKGHRVLIEAFSKLSSNSVLCIAGQGELSKDLKAHAERYGVSSRVQFLGGRRDMEQIYPLADVFVLPSHWEGMPNVMLEAMASGLAVIATRVGGVPEILNENNGIIVEPGAVDELTLRMKELSQDSPRMQRLGQKARESVSNMTWGKHVDSLLSISGRMVS